MLLLPHKPKLYMKAGDKLSRNAAIQQQFYLQFQYQDFRAPSPIPEGSPNPIANPQRFVGRSIVLRPSSTRPSQEQIQSLSRGRHKLLKLTFTKNMKGMGMLLAESTDHGVWPTVPFGWLWCWKQK